MTDHNKRWDWRIILGAILTSLWIGAGLVYLLGVVGAGAFVALPTGDIGSFLEGAFAPLAFLWLVIGHFMQQSEISANTRAIMLQEQSAERQEIHAQRTSYFQLLKLVQEQLGSIAGFMYLSICGPTGTGEVSSEDFNKLRGDSSADHAVFIRKMIAMAVAHRESPEQVNEFFFGTEIRTRHANNFTKTFQKLLDNAAAVDHDDLLSNALLYGSAAGFLFRIIRFSHGDETYDPILGLATIQAREDQS